LEGGYSIKEPSPGDNERHLQAANRVSARILSSIVILFAKIIIIRTRVPVRAGALSLGRLKKDCTPATLPGPHIEKCSP